MACYYYSIIYLKNLLQTIIESLKYITTEVMPPGCGRGQSFVHDPKMAKEMAVKGQIKLRVKTAKGEKARIILNLLYINFSRYHLTLGISFV